MTSNFIIIDDDPISKLLCEKALSHVFTDSSIRQFAIPIDGLLYLSEAYSNQSMMQPTLLFLDINMPEMNGWEFLKCFSAFDNAIKSKISIVILSSSNDPSDKKRAMSNVYVSDYIVKPLLQNSLNSVLFKYKKAA